MVLESNTLDVLFVKDGQQGEDGKILYTWIKYAKDANGTGMTDDPNGAVYIGISYNNESSTESNDPTQYAWTKIQGADGKKGEDAYTIFLENENISFATDENRDPLSEQAYTSGITIMKGAKPVTDFIIGDIAKTQGIAVAKTDTAIAISVINGNPLPSDNGAIEIPITVGGTVFKKILSWTCSKKGDQGIQGPQGVQGEKGKDGTSVTITNKSITYQLSASGTVVPTGTWQTSPQTIPEGQYQWTKTSVTYSDGNKTESYSISYRGKNGSDGTSVKTTSTSVKYQVGDSGTTKPTGAWQNSVPTVAQGKYLWTQTIVNYSDGNSTESYSVSYKGIDGSNGSNGMNAATVYLYQRATSTPSKPSNALTYTFSTTKITGTLNNGWSTAIPTGTDAVYVTVASVSSKSDTTTIATSAWSAPVVLAQNGKSGSDGKAGLNVATIYLYQRATSKPSKPSASVTYTFNTGVASGLNNGWSQKIPDGTNPLYVTLATASSNTATDTILSSEWSDVVVMAQNGEDGQDGISPKVTLSKSGDTTTISIVDATGTHTQTVKDGTNGTPGAAGKDGKTSYFHVKYSNDGGKTFTGNSGEDTGIYMGSYTDYTEADSTDVSKYTWVKVKGDKGDTGQKGDNAKNLSITPSSQYFKSTDGGKTFAPNTITIKPTIQGEINFGKWQYSIDGGVSFADVVNGQKGLTISNNVLTVSRDSSLYSDAVTMVTFRAVASDSSFYDTCSIAKIYDVSDIQIGGRNLAKKGCIALWDDSATFNDDTFSEDGSVVFSRKSAAANSGVIIDRYVNYEKDEHYIVSFKMRVTSGTVNSFYLWNGKGHTNNSVYVDGIKSGTLHADVSFPTDDQYHQITAYFTATGTTSTEASDIDINHHLILQPIKGTTATYTVQLLNFKIEKGNKATDWTPAPEDVQTAILSTKSEISDVSIKVNNNKQAIEQRVEKTTYEQDLNLVKGNISKANEGLNKWRYEIYPKSLFTSEYQGKSTMDVFAKNTNLTPSQSVLINDTDLSIAWNYDNNYIGYALTFAKFSAAKSVAITFAHDDGAHIYLNGKLIGGSDAYSQTGESLTLDFVKGWNCIEVVVNEGASTEGFKLGTTLSALPECQLMNCYYGTPVARQSHITNQLVENTTNIDGISTKVSKVTSVIGEGGENFTSFKNEYSDFKQTMNGFKTTVSQTYVTKDDFNGLEIGGRNLLLYSQTIRAHKDYYGVGWLTDEVETFNGCPVWSVKNQWGRLTWLFKSHVIDRGLVKVGDTLTYSLYAKTNNASGKSINCSYRFKGNANAYWFNGSAFNVGTNWTRYSVTFTITKDMLATDTYMTEIGFEETASMSGDDKVYYACPKLERGTKATDYTPALEDNEINGQNLVSNLSSNWEQGSVSYVANSTYASIKTVLATRLRTEDVFSVSGNVTISAGTSTNSSKEELNFYYVLFDVNKKAIGVPASGSEWQSLTSPKIINCGDAKYMAIILRWGSGSTVITPSNISQICLKIERGTSATPFTLAPEDVNGKIVNVETIANQTADKFSWIVKSGTSSSNFEITDRLMNLVSANINLDGIVSFMNTAKGDGRKNLYNLDYSSFENVASQKDAICYAKDNGVTSVSIDSSVSYDGNKSLKISYTTANLNSSTTPLYLGSSANNYGCVKIQAGKQYLLSCYVKSDSATGLFMIDIQGHDTPDTKTDGLYLSNIDPRKLPGSSTGVNLSTDWQRAICAIKVADNATGLYWSVVPLIWGKPSSSNVPQTFNVWVDCIMLEEVDSISNEPGTYILDKETIIDGGSVKADTITGNQILAGSITADKIATDAIKSHNYISSGGTQGSFLNLGDGSFTSPNLSWDSNGNLIAKNANLSGEITATKGKIGKYTITDQWLITGSGSTASGFGGNQAFWAGSSSSNDAPFRVGYNGKLYANGATISGDITATTGKIGDLTLKDGILTGTGSYSEPYTEDDGGTVTSTITTNYITKLFGKGLTIDSTVKYSDEDDVYSYKVSVLPDEISFTDGEEIGMLGAGGLQILQVNDNSDSYSSEANEVSLSSGASNFYYTTPVNQTTDKYLHVCFSADGASFMASQGDKFNSFDIGYSSAKYSGNFAANKFVYTGNSLNYVECLEANDTTNIYFHSNGYYSFRVNNEGNWSNETQSVYITGRGISVPGQIGLYSQEMSNYVARYYIAGSTKSTAIGNNSYQTRIYGSSVWANKAVSTSDVRLKQDFQSLDKFEDLYMQLQPVSFKYIDGYDKSEDRYFGLKAQPTEKLFEDMGENPDDYAMFNKFGIDHEDIKERIGYDVDFDEEHGLDYTNLITLNTHMVQKTRRELAELQKENAELKDMLKTIVKKINM